MVISSVGDPNEQDHHGLFVYVYRHGKISEDRFYTQEVIGLQTAKLPGLVNRNEAEWLSKLDPDQLENLAEMIGSASPISKKTYTSFINP